MRGSICVNKMLSLTSVLGQCKHRFLKNQCCEYLFNINFLKNDVKIVISTSVF